jgi:glucose/arabinose dehydrogenase
MAGAYTWVWLAMVLALALAGCADDGAADEASEATTAGAPAESTADTPDTPEEMLSQLSGDIEPDAEVIAVCQQFFDDVASLAEAGDTDAMLEAVRSWSATAEGTAIEAEATAIADMLTQVGSGNMDAMEDFASASTEFGMQCAMRGWEDPSL